MKQTYSLMAGATISIIVSTDRTGPGYEVSATLDTKEADKNNHENGENGGTLVQNMEGPRGFTAEGSYLHYRKYYKRRLLPSAAAARRLCQSLINRCDAEVEAAIGRREAKLRMMKHILPKQN